MNAFDRDNLDWYIGASKKELAQWYDDATVEDIRYMVKLIQEELTDLRLQELDLVESEIDTVAKQTTKLLNKFRLSKNS